MDIVLEILDGLVYDRVYALVAPGVPGPQAYDAYKLAANTTFSSVHESAKVALNNYQYRPASKYIHLAPSKYAYLSSMARDDPLRQFISLYMTTW